MACLYIARCTAYVMDESHIYKLADDERFEQFQSHGFRKTAFVEPQFRIYHDNASSGLYGTLMDFDETTTGVIDIRKVRAKFKLVNAMTGQVVWERGLGVRSETRMSGNTGAAATILTRAADARDKEVPWVTIASTTINENNVGRAFAFDLGTKLLTQAIGIHLDYETKEMIRRVGESLPWGPGPSAATH